MADAIAADDDAFMRTALALAARARYRTHPNPQVGCVIVGAGRIVGQGYHQQAGCAHAEVHALRAAGAAARGATAYVTLEPCSHHGRTPPCADALIAAGVTRVVAAMADPDPRVAGRGLERLQAAGIQVESGRLGDWARALNRPYLTLQRTGRPHVVLKTAMTLDGKIATVGGHSQWITGPASRADVHQLRDQVDAIVVGVRTALADDPQLNTRCLAPGPLALAWDLPADIAAAPALADAGDVPPWQPRHPLRVVVDSLGRTPPTARLLPALVATTPLAPPPRLAALRAAGAEVITLEPDRDGLVPLPPLLAELGRRGIASLLVEGGSQVMWSFLGQGLADSVRFYIAPKLVGGMQAPGPIGGPGAQRLEGAWPVTGLHVRPVGADLVLEGDIAPNRVPDAPQGAHPSPGR